MGKQLRDRVERLAQQTIGTDSAARWVIVCFVGSQHRPVVAPPGVKIYEEDGQRYFYDHDEEGNEIRGRGPQGPNCIGVERRFIVTEPVL